MLGFLTFVKSVTLTLGKVAIIVIILYTKCRGKVTLE